MTSKEKKEKRKKESSVIARQRQKREKQGARQRNIITPTIPDEIAKEKFLRELYKENFNIDPLRANEDEKQRYEIWKKEKGYEDMPYSILVGRIEESKKEKKERERHEYLQKIALELSQKFSYHQLANAARGEGFEVHGYLEKTFGIREYDAMIDEYLLDRACDYAKIEYTPEEVSIINKLVIKELDITKVTMGKEALLHNYPHSPFFQFFIMTDGPIEESIQWIPKYPWNVDGQDVDVTMLPANILLFKWLIWNMPVFIKLHSPGKNQMLHKVIADANALRRKETELYTHALDQVLSELGIMEDKLDAAVRDGSQARKHLDHFKKKLYMKKPRNVLGEIEKEERYFLEGKQRNWEMILLVVIIFAIIGLFIFFAISQKQTKITEPTNTKEDLEFLWRLISFVNI